MFIFLPLSIFPTLLSTLASLSVFSSRLLYLFLFSSSLSPFVLPFPFLFFAIFLHLLMISCCLPDPNPDPIHTFSLTLHPSSSLPPLQSFTSISATLLTTIPPYHLCFTVCLCLENITYPHIADSSSRSRAADLIHFLP